MQDRDLLAGFEACSLSEEQWTHRAHVRVAWMYTSRFDFETATARMRSGLHALNAAIGTPDAIDRGYHETITQAFMRLVFVACRQLPAHESSDAFCDAHPELMTKFALREYYSRDRIMTMKAKQEFVEPDLAPLPMIDDRE